MRQVVQQYVISSMCKVLKVGVKGEYNGTGRGGEKMKKLTTAGLLLALAVGLSACGGGEKPSSAPADQNQSQSQNQSATTSGSGGDEAKKVMEGKCISCHGQNLEGGAGPELQKVGSRLSKDEIAKIIKEGRPGTAMPGGLLNDEETEKVASYLAEQK
jgi:mono/diheme cytochrome c family protein